MPIGLGVSLEPGFPHKERPRLEGEGGSVLFCCHCFHCCLLTQRFHSGHSPSTEQVQEVKLGDMFWPGDLPS